MQITNGIDAIDLALFLKKEKVLVVSDFHIGFEESLNKQGVFVPRFQLKDILLRLEKIFEITKPDTVVINGDLKHEFGRISEQEWRDVLRVIDFVGKNCKETILIKGNHDTILGPIAQKRNVKILEEFGAGSVMIIHGDKVKEMNKSIKTIIIGHEHPAISLREKGRVEKFKCFLKGKFAGKNLLVQPSFNLVVEGTDVLKEQLLSPFLKNISDFEVFVVNDKSKEILEFGKVKNLL